MSTTTLYETTAQTGTVSSANSTSLYSNTTDFTTGLVNSSVYSVNGGLGVTVNPTTGNVVVSIGQDVATTANVTFANITATGNLSNAYYTLANAAGTNGQVLTTNGAGVTTWTTPSSLGLVTSVTGSGAGISVSPTTGAVIVSNTGVTSAVAGTGIGVSAGTGAVTFSNTGVTSIVAGSNISISGGTGAVTINATGFGTGDVSGPASATDNAIVRFDGTTGKLIQNSTVTIDDTTGNITTNGDIAVNGGDISTLPGGIANLYNNNAVDTINIGNSVVTEVNIGNIVSGRVYAKTPSFETASNAIVGDDLTVNGGNIKINGTATTGVQPFLTFQTQADGVNPLYGIRGKSALNDAWLVGSGSTGSDQGYLEIATGDNAGTPGNGGQIYARQYNNGATAPFGVPWEGGTGVVVNEFILLDDNGDTSIPNNLTVGDNITLNSDKADVDVDLTFGRLGAVNAVIRWNSTSDSFEWSADGTTYYDFINADITTPTVGNLLYYNGTNWINTDVIATSISANRPVFQYDNSTAGVNTAITLRKNLGASTFANGDGSFVKFEVDSNTQATTEYGVIGMEYNTATPNFYISSSIDDGASYQQAFTGNTAGVDVWGNSISLSKAQASGLNNASFNVERGSDPTVEILWNEGANRWQTTVDGTNYLNIPNQNLDTTDSPTFSAVVVDSQAALDSSTLTTTSTATVSLNATARNAMTGLINIIQGSNVHCLNFTALRIDSTTAMLTTYAEMYNNTSLGSFTADVSGGNLRLLVTPSSATSTVFSVVRTSLT